MNEQKKKQILTVLLLAVLWVKSRPKERKE